MMEELSTHLSTSVTPEVQAAVQEAFELFDQYGVQDYETAYLDALMTGDNHDPMGVTQALLDLTSGYQDEILTNLLVTLSDDTTVAQGNTVLRVLKQLEDTELTQEVQVICAESQDPAEALCDLISLITGEPSESYYELIEEVGAELIERIRQTVQPIDQSEGVQPVDPGDTKAMLDRLKTFQEFTGKKSKVLGLLVLDMPLGLPYHEYYLALREDIESLKPADMARELYAAALVAQDTQGNPRTAILAELNATYTSADKITPIATAMETLILQFQAALTAGVKKVKS